MAAPLPATLKSADLARFALRAHQVEKFKPAVAYWCNYWIVNQILSKSLHTADTESMNYTTVLVERLEQIRAENADNDIIANDDAGQAYVEQFGLETFQRAENAIQANKVTRQTADTFLAAATFLDLLHIWGTPDAEIAAKVKYAKFHALRIAKAIKAGEDPNLSNPAPTPPIKEEPLDPDDLEVQLLSTPPATDVPHQPTIEEVPDETAPGRADHADHVSLPAVSPPHDRDDPGHHDSRPDADNEAVSPLELPSAPEDVTGGGYFPEVPMFVAQDGTQNLPSAPPDLPTQQHPPFPPPSASYNPDPYYTSPPAPSAPTAPHQVPTAPSPYGSSPQPPPGLAHQAPTPTQPHAPSPYPAPIPHQTQPQPHLPPQAAPPAAGAGVGAGGPVSQTAFIADEEAIMKAQKHARWAISALNFEDVKTAVKELRGALETLGATPS